MTNRPDNDPGSGGARNVTVRLRRAGVIAAVGACAWVGGRSWAAIAPALPTIPEGVFNIVGYGAVGDGVTTNTGAIQAAVGALERAGGGTLEVPAGDFLSGPFVLGSQTRLRLEAGATLRLLPYGAYPASGRPPAFITVATGAHDVELCGPGKVEGQGGAWWAAKLDEAHRPYEIHLRDCHRLFVHDWNSQNPPMKHIVIDGASGDITVQNVTNIAPYPSPNTDGLNLQGTNCVVRDSTFRGGDDNVAIGRSSGPCAETLITNLTCGTGHGISLGSITTAGISNVTVVDCTFSGTDFGVRLKAGADRGGLVRNITCARLWMTNVATPIAIYSYYKEKGPNRVSAAQAAGFPAGPVTRTTPIWRDITLSQVTATGATLAGIIWGRPEMMVSNVTLEEINIRAARAFDIYNARQVRLIDSRITPASGSSLAVYNAQVTISNRAPVEEAVTVEGLEGANSLELWNARVGMSSARALGANPISLAGSTLANAGDLELPDSTTVNFAVGARPAMVRVRGNLRVDATLGIREGGGFGAGAYTLFACEGALSGSPRLGAAPAGYRWTYDTAVPGQGRLVVTRER